MSSSSSCLTCGITITCIYVVKEYHEGKKTFNDYNKLYLFELEITWRMLFMDIFAFFGNFKKKLDGDGNDGYHMLDDSRIKRSFWKGSRGWGSQVSNHNTSFKVKINILGITFCFGKQFRLYSV